MQRFTSFLHSVKVWLSGQIYFLPATQKQKLQVIYSLLCVLHTYKVMGKVYGEKHCIPPFKKRKSVLWHECHTKLGKAMPIHPTVISPLTLIQMASLSCLTRVRLQTSAGYKELEPGTEFYFPLMLQDLPQSQICSRQVDGLINQLSHWLPWGPSQRESG